MGGRMVYYGLVVLAVLLLVTAFVPLLRLDWGWVRMADFPRLQFLALYVMAAAALIPFWKAGFLSKALIAGLVVASGSQLLWIYPYMPLAGVQSQAARGKDPARRIRLLTANVLQTNRSASQLLEIVDRADPDVLVAVEVNRWWIDELQPLERTFQHSVKYPLDNKYGMAFYSKLPVKSAEVRFLVEQDVPSIDATVLLPSGEEVRLMAIHPRPPRPGVDTEERDAELVIAGREMRRCHCPAIILGDLNDVGWSATTRLFQEVSRLLDPRIGRGMYPTYNANYWFLRYPLDHLFHSDHFRLARIRVLEGFGSDHFPLFVELSYDPEAAKVQEAPPADAETRERAEETLKDVGASESTDK